MTVEYIYCELVDSLRECLAHLERLRMANPADKQILELKRSLREQIRRIEDRERQAA